jgi:hypothetical protein
LSVVQKQSGRRRNVAMGRSKMSFVFLLAGKPGRVVYGLGQSRLMGSLWGPKYRRIENAPMPAECLHLVSCGEEFMEEG